MTPVLQVVQRVLSRYLLEQAGLKAGKGDCGVAQGPPMRRGVGEATEAGVELRHNLQAS